MSIPKIDRPSLIQQTQQGKEVYKAPTGQVAQKELAFSIFEKEVTKHSKQRNADIIAHENAHERTAGQFATGKVINYGTDQIGKPIATDGHVSVKMPPKVDFKNPMPQILQAEEHAKAVAASAIAPASLGGDAGRLSAADQSVHARAMSTLGITKTAKSQRLNFEANIQSKNGQMPDKNQELNSEMIASSKTQGEKREKDRKPLNIFG